MRTRIGLALSVLLLALDCWLLGRQAPVLGRADEGGFVRREIELVVGAVVMIVPITL